MYIALF